MFGVGTVPARVALPVRKPIPIPLSMRALPAVTASLFSAQSRSCIHLPDGQFPHARHAQIARRANLSHVSALAPSGKSERFSRTSRLDEEGRIAIVTIRGAGMRWTRPCRVRMRSQGGDSRERSREARETSGSVADGQSVWSWHPLLVSSWRRRVGPTGRSYAVNSSTTVARRIRRRGERAIDR
jgi:hypothetical protein